MKFEELFTANGVSLIRRGEKNTEYAVVQNLDKKKGEWDHTIAYYGYGHYYPGMSEAAALGKAIDVFRAKTEEGYIPYPRLQEIAEEAIDGMMQIDVDEAVDICKNCIELDEDEQAFFHIAEAMQNLCGENR